MRRLLLPLTLLSLFAGACSDDADITAGDSPGSSTTTSSAPGTTSTPATPSSTTVPTTTTGPQGMCGDLIPVVTDEGTNCVDPDAPVTSTVPIDGEARRLLVAEDGRLVVYTVGDRTFGFESRIATEHIPTAVHQSHGGTVFTREYEDIGGGESRVEIARYEPDGTRSVVEEIVELYDATVIDGIEVIIGSVRSTDGVGFGGVKALAIDDYREVADFGLGAEAEFGVTDFAWNDGVGIGVASAWSDLTEWVGFVDVDGDRLGLPSPTDDLAYNAPPYVTAATISHDGDTLYWAEGPDWGFDPETNESGPKEAPWILRGADLQTGEERLYWPLSEPVLDSAELNIESIEDLGDWILINRSVLRGTVPTPLAPLVLDLTFEEPELSEFPAIGPATGATG